MYIHKYIHTYICIIMLNLRSIRWQGPKARTALLQPVGGTVWSGFYSHPQISCSEAGFGLRRLCLSATILLLNAFEEHKLGFFASHRDTVVTCSNSWQTLTEYLNVLYECRCLHRFWQPKAKGLGPLLAQADRWSHCVTFSCWQHVGWSLCRLPAAKGAQGAQGAACTKWIRCFRCFSFSCPATWAEPMHGMGGSVAHPIAIYKSITHTHTTHVCMYI